MRKWWVWIGAAIVVIGIEYGSPKSQPVPLAKTTTPTVDRSQGLRDYLRKNYSTATWYPNVRTVGARGSVAWIETDLFPKEENADVATGICRGVSSYVFSTENTVGLDGVTVRASNGQRLAARRSINEPC